MVKRNVQEHRLVFTTQLLAGTSDVYYVAVGTPSNEQGAADLRYVLSAVKMIGEHIDRYCVIVDKSTVPVGVADKVSQVVREALDARGLTHVTVDVVGNPEF